MKKLKGIWLCIGLIWASTLIPIYAADSVTKAEKELQNINQKLRSNQKKITQKKRQKAKAQRSLGSIRKELRYTEYQLKKARKQLTNVKYNERKTQEELVKIEEDFQKKQDHFVKRLREIYKNQNLGFIEFLFSSNDFRSIMDSQYYFERIMKEDTQLIDEIKAEKAAIEDQKKDLEKKRREIEALNAKIKRQEASLAAKKKSKSRFIRSLQSAINRIEKQNKELEESSGKLAQFIVGKGQGGTEYYATGSYIKPAKGWLSSRFGYRRHPISKRRRMHNGIDLAAPRGYRIRAANSGVVIVAGRKSKYRGYGKVTVIDHGRRKSDGKRISTVYAHQSRILVKEGDFVKKGKVIGLVGTTGYSTGPHLHFEVRKDGVPANPLKFIKI